MKWGKRRRSNSDSEASETPAAKPRKVAGKTVTDDGKDISRMSDKQLRERINRINMEQQYSKMTSEPKAASRISKGKDQIDNAMKYWNTANSLYTAYHSPMGKEIKKVVEEKLLHR